MWKDGKAWVYSASDPHRRLHQAIDCGGWVIGYCHCPMPGKAIRPWKDCTLQEPEDRFETVRRVGGEAVWLAEPTEVIRYMQDRQASSCCD